MTMQVSHNLPAWLLSLLTACPSWNQRSPEWSSYVRFLKLLSSFPSSLEYSTNSLESYLTWPQLNTLFKHPRTPTSSHTPAPVLFLTKFLQFLEYIRPSNYFFRGSRGPTPLAIRPRPLHLPYMCAGWAADAFPVSAQAISLNNNDGPRSGVLNDFGATNVYSILVRSVTLFLKHYF